MSNCMFCNEPGEWTFSLPGEVCQHHWENPHGAVSLSARLVELEAENAALLKGVQEAAPLAGGYLILAQEYVKLEAELAALRAVAVAANALPAFVANGDWFASLDELHGAVDNARAAGCLPTGDEVAS